MRYRKGRKGLYYTDGKLDRCTYNDCCASLWALYIRWWQTESKYFFSDMKDAFVGAVMLILAIVLFPVVPFVNIVATRIKYRKKVKADKFTNDYYEEV